MLPRVVVHVAVSLDGRIDWFAPDVGLFYELIGRWREDATLVGVETILRSFDGPPPEDAAAAPPAPPPGADDGRPLLVVPDSRGRLRCWDALRAWPYWRDRVALISRATPAEARAHLAGRGVATIEAGADQVDLRAALAELGARYGVASVRVDSGGTLNGALLRAGLVDEVSVLIHPCLVGGLSPRSFFRAPDLTAADGVIDLRLLAVDRPRDDVVWLRYAVVPHDAG